MKRDGERDSWHRWWCWCLRYQRLAMVVCDGRRWWWWSTGHIVWSTTPTLAPRTRERGKERKRERERERYLPPPAAGGATRGDPFLFSPLGHSREARAPTRCRPIGPRRPSTNTRPSKRVRTATFHRVTFPKVTSRNTDWFGAPFLRLPFPLPHEFSLITAVVVIVVVVVVSFSPPPRDSVRPRGLWLINRATGCQRSETNFEKWWWSFTVFSKRNYVSRN